MANKNPKKENLKSLKDRTKKEQRKIQSAGGKKSGEVRREKKLLSQIYAEILADEKGIDGNGKTIKEVVNEILTAPIMLVSPSAKVSMLKEIRETTEGTKADITSGGKPLNTGLTRDQVREEIAALEALKNAAK